MRAEDMGERAGAPPDARAPLDAGQARVVAHRGGRLHVLGGPGSGKSTALAAALAARAAVEPAGTVVGLAGDRRAVAALRADVARRTGSGLLPVIGTIHSLAFSIVRTWRSPGADDDAEEPRLLSGAEEDVRMRELLLGAVADGQVAWPADLQPALPTLGLANEVRAFLARMRERGVGPADLRRVDHAPGVWTALADFAILESQVMALENVVDYPELLDLARRVVAGSPGRARSLHAIYVDSAQDLDPLSIRLLDALVAEGADLVAAGDPDQAVLGFRGAVPDLLRGAGGGDGVGGGQRSGGGHPADGATRIALSGSYRCPPGAIPAARRVLARDPRAGTDPAAGEPAIVVRGFDSAFDLGSHVAGEIRDRVLATGSGTRRRWSDTAVIVRSAGQIDAIRRALENAGVPVAAHAGDVPLAAEPAVRELLDALAAAIDPFGITAQRAIDLLIGPLAGVDADDIRAQVPPEAVRDLLVAAIASGAAITSGAAGAAITSDAAGAEVPPGDPGAQRGGVSGSVAAGIQGLAGLLRSAGARSAAGEPPAAVLWDLWAGALPSPVPWPDRLRAAALDGDRAAHRDLDAVLALFATAERFSDRLAGVAGTPAFLAALREQRVPAEPIADRSPQRDAVEILTAHRAAGREWEHVVVVGAQEGAWPARSGAGSLLRRELLEGAPASRATAQLAEERRLLFVALTRARQQTTVAVIDSTADAGEQPSRFLDDLGIAVRRPGGFPPRPATLDGLVGELRSVAEDPQEPANRRSQAIDVLALLAAQTDEAGAAVVPAAHPDAWWGLREPTAADAPTEGTIERPIEVSPSEIDTLLECPLRWFLERRARANPGSASVLAVGSLVHALAEAVGRGDLPADPEVLDAVLEPVWGDLDFAAPWESQAGRAWVRDALARFCAYHSAATRDLVAVEVPVRVEIEIADRPVAIRGLVDRVEQDDEGRIIPVDLKTSARSVSRREAERHRQLALYQMALADADSHPGGAELVYLRQGSLDMPKVLGQPPLTGPDATGSGDRRGDLLDDVATAVRLMSGPDFPPCPGHHCGRCPFVRLCPAHEGSGIDVAGSAGSADGYSTGKRS